MTTANADRSFLSWAAGMTSTQLVWPRSVAQQVARKFEQEIQGSFRKSEYLDKPRRILDLAEKELGELWHLEKNWDSYGADVPHQSAIEAARSFLLVAAHSDLNFTRILPSAEGGVAVAFFNEEKRAIAEFLNDGTRDLILYDISGVMSSIEAKNESPEAFQQAISEYLLRGEG